MSSKSETTQLVDSQLAASAAVAGAGFVNESANQVKKARKEGLINFRILAFLGGLAMVFSNGIAVLDRFFSFNVPGAMIAVYGVLFGIVIVIMEGPGPCSKPLWVRVRYNAKFLEHTWGRGLLYVFVGSLQISNLNILDWAVGGFMIFVGFVSICAGFGAAKNMKLLKFSIKDEADLKRKWHEFDADENGVLDVKELTAFIKSQGIDMTKHEIAATFLALDKNFDDKLSYEEFYAWWFNADAPGSRSMTV